MINHQLNAITKVKLPIAALLPTLMLSVIHWLSTATIQWAASLQIWFFAMLVLFFAPIFEPKTDGGSKIRIHTASVFLVTLTISLGGIYWLTENTLVAWLFMATLYTLFLGWINVLGANTPLWHRFLLESGFTLTAGLLPNFIVQIETSFSSEEFFIAIECLILTLFWLTLRVSYIYIKRGIETSSDHSIHRQINRNILIVGFFFINSAIILISIRAYQLSFFTREAPGFPGITEQSPFLCGNLPIEPDKYHGVETFNRLLEQVEVNHQKDAPDYAFLALATGNIQWALEFRLSILSEARLGMFTEAAGSVKYGQYLASQRAYFFPLVRDAFPGVFSTADELIISDWFKDINKRAMTVEWVDWLYALAFRYWPKGPYENQENGAGLLSLLEVNGLASNILSERNKQYLADNPRGWGTNFSVTDDAAFYQPEWMENAWFQSFYTNELNAINQKQSFEWLKILALPDGSPLRYNHVGALQNANHAYWGAYLLNDGNLLWLSARALDYMEGSDQPLKGQPGAEFELGISGTAPAVGSCLVYGNSGLPTQVGPLAPDKIVFRSGWKSDDIYMLLNLRFTGWHRYKASNSLVQIYKNEPLVIENINGNTFDWLPTGRSLFRDKRIPRENLNGLVVKKTGLPFVLYKLTGIGGPWAQDPPHYANVTHFESSPELTVSSTLIDDWHGWRHQRTIYFYPQGVGVIIDDALGMKKNHPAALTWHLVGRQILNGNRVLLGQNPKKGESPEAILLPISSRQPTFHSVQSDGEQPLIQAVYNASSSASLQTATIFLFDDWVGGQVQIRDQKLTIKQATRNIEIDLTEVFNE